MGWKGFNVSCCLEPQKTHATALTPRFLRRLEDVNPLLTPYSQLELKAMLSQLGVSRHPRLRRHRSGLIPPYAVSNVDETVFVCVFPMAAGHLLRRLPAAWPSSAE